MRKTLKKGFLALMVAVLFTMVTPSILPQEMQTVEAASVKLSKSKLTLIKGTSSTLKITGTSAKVKWSSNKKSVATVSSSGKVTAKKKGVATITANVNGQKYTCKVTVETPKISKTSLTLKNGKTSTLKVTGTTKKVTWTSSKKSVATVSSNGKVTGKKPGTAIITAKVGGKKYTCEVTVKKILSVSQSNVSITDTESCKVTTTFTESDGTISYKIGDTSIVSCKWESWSGYDIPLTITGKKVGSTTVKITNDVNSETCTIKVTVKETAVKSITLSSTEMSLEDGDSDTLSATINPSNATNTNITWSSSDSSVAIVNSSGKVTAMSTGSATITAEAGGVTASCSVSVYVPVSIEVPSLPVTIRTYTSLGKLQTICDVENVRCEVNKSGSQYYYKIYIAGTKTYDSSGSSYSRACKVGYKLYNTDGAVVESGTIYSTDVCTGEKFAECYTNGFIASGNYTLELLNVK